jgi:two-component system, chemotaxis family, sensor kinase CheA
MRTANGEFLAQLRATFQVEAEEHLQAMAAGLLQLEGSAAPEVRRGALEGVFRAAHSLKGAARTVDADEIEALCQSLEEVLSSWKRGESAPSPGAFDALHRKLDAVSAALGACMARWAERPPGAPKAPAVAAVERAAPAAPAPAPVQEAPPSEETVRISVGKLDAHLRQAEEMLAAKLMAQRRMDELVDLGRRLASCRDEWTTVEPETHALRQSVQRAAAGRDRPSPAGPLDRLLALCDWNREQVGAIASTVEGLVRAARQERHAVGKMVEDLLEDSKRLLLLPFATVAAPLPKLVRDLCRDQGKEADLVIRGESTEIDKRILEEIKDPLVHLLRNSVDHGIEPPEQRVRRGKPARATITLAVSRLDGNKVQVVLSDDGAGIDARKVKDSSVRQGLITAQEAQRLDPAQALALIFQSGVSTSPIVTQLSGRGLGLAIVREKAQKLGGEVSVESGPGTGSVFRIELPSVRATFRGILVEAAGRLLVVPTEQVERAMRAAPGDILTVEGRDTISLGGRALPLVRLAEVLELPDADGEAQAAQAQQLLVLGSGEQRVAFIVDAVLDEREVLVKPLRKPLVRVRNVAAVTVLGSGQVVPILAVEDLLRSARKLAGPGTRASQARPVKRKARAILVAEDSITSRMLLKGILESAGYRVRTAVDGMEAFQLLREERFDLVVSDVEMPRLNGFDLTARIRADAKLAELPVVLVTALETRQDRERGIDAGANAYIVKSSFDQSDLLEAVRRLV